MTRKTLRTVVHSLMVHARFSEAYIHFALMYKIDQIFPVLPIKCMVNKDGEPTTPFKHATGTKPSVSHFFYIFVYMLYKKILHKLGKVR